MPKQNDRLAPLIKWAGGKEKEAGYILPNCPADIEDYYDPFVGGGSVYLSIEARHSFINDKSEELMALYRNIAAGNARFYRWADAIAASWSAMAHYAEEHAEPARIYEAYREGRIGEETLRSRLMRHLERNSAALDAVLPGEFLFVWHRPLYAKELRANLVRKLQRMRCIEREKQRLSDRDVAGNIETAFMSALYMYFRALYNDAALLAAEPELASALFLFIRNYAYSGMFRYNDRGEFNVPYGGLGYNRKTLSKKLEYYRSERLGERLRATVMENLDFEEFFRLHRPTERDFVFLDPPYDTEFSTYARNAFTRADQQRLAHYLTDECPARWMMVIKNTPFIHALYDRPELTIRTFDKRYLVSFMNRNDKRAEHLLITNY